MRHFSASALPGFDYELMCLGQDKLLYHMKDYEEADGHFQ